MISKGVISPYVQKQGRMLLKFNSLGPHDVTHYCARNECQSFKAALK